VRDLLACVRAVVDPGDDASLFRTAALPQFAVDPEQLRSALRQIAKDSRKGTVVPLSSVLGEVAGGAEVLSCVRRAQEEVRAKQAKTQSALRLIAKQFRLDLASPVLQAVFEFAAAWEKKCTTETKELREWAEYLDYFREAGGVIPMGSTADEDAVRLMTAHGVKGLEFPHVFILRANSGTFPTSYREGLVEFPRELRDPDSAVAGDDKTLTDQEERRLFYVAMTRAKDTLRIYGKQGVGQRDKTPPGYLRELIGNAGLQRWLRTREALASQPELIELAAAADENYPPGSKLPVWLALPPVEGLGAQLSATAVETYENCPLQFKFEREWKLSRQVHAAMQYGQVMHDVLRTYYDAIRVGRPKGDDELLGMFTEQLAAAGIQDEYQEGLYRKQGLKQLQEFLEGARTAAAPEVLHTEEWFDVQVAGSKVTGRIDRVDRAADGSVIIVDYKTGKARTQDDADESLQLSIYAIAAEQKWGYRVGGLAFHNLDGNVPVISRRSEFELEQAKERVVEVAKGIAAGNFQAKPDFRCNFCGFRGLCPAKEKLAPKMNGKHAGTAMEG
jgi:ATP-dependent exoDNAse (exonuclease V) beta subunit